MGDHPLKVLLEMRPAFDGHAGIPQETRLLFRGLNLIEGVSVEGLLQSAGRVLSRGLPAHGPGELPPDQQLDRLSRVVVSAQENLSNPYAACILMALRRMAGMSEGLDRFDPAHFRDFVWRSLFARTLPAADFENVTRAGFRIARIPWNGMHRVALATRRMGHALYPRIDTSDFDVMITETPYPATVSRNTRLVVRYHDAIPILMPHTIADRTYHQASHYQALRTNVNSGAHFACVSESTRKDLLSIFPAAEPRCVTIHNMVSHQYFVESSPASRVPEIIETRASPDALLQSSPQARAGLGRDARPFTYLLIVSTIEPRKNHASLVEAWERLRATRFPDLKLVLVGKPGWDYAAAAAKCRPWLDRGAIFALEDVPSPELRILYEHAAATVCASFGEGFDFSGVESMRCATPVVASDIPVHREIFADAAEYFSPYAIAELAHAIELVLDPANRAHRDELVRKGLSTSSRYASENILPKWKEYLLAPGRVKDNHEH